MRANRREFLQTSTAGLGLLAFGTEPAISGAAAERARLVKPRRLAAGDTVGIVNPVCSEMQASDLEDVENAMSALGLKVKRCVRSGRARAEQARACELNELFADDSVTAILPVRGGWGCARLLRHLDYHLIERNPKILMGFSDVSALLLGIQARTGLVTFHGPMGISPWVSFTVEQMRRVLFDAEAAVLGSPVEAELDAVRGPRTLVPGKARGRLLGGNLTVVSSLVGSPYFQPSDDVILFLEEVREPLSEVDRMLTQLELAGVLERVRGFVFGQCTGCQAPTGDAQLTLESVLADHIGRLGIPAWRGAPIGHVARQLTLPIGVMAEIDASACTIRLLEPGVC